VRLGSIGGPDSLADTLRADVKFLLLPLAIAAFILVLLVLGAIGLGVALLLIATIGRFFRLLNRSRRPRRS
jgi:hypothetical protein